jgi:hypothetical protein
MLFAHGILKSELKKGGINYLINGCKSFFNRNGSSCGVMIKYKRRRLM